MFEVPVTDISCFWSLFTPNSALMVRNASFPRSSPCLEESRR